MSIGLSKEDLRVQYLFPKSKLRGARNAQRLTTAFAGALIGLSRRQYELKENGKYPFNDYEMLILSEYFEIPVGTLFFEE